MDDLELYLYGILPMIFGLFILLKSIQILSNGKTILNWIISTIILVSTLFAEYILAFVLFKEAWPTYLPHILILFNLLLLFAQIKIKKRNAQII
ncbi:hypothetical protein [Flavobacterium sp. WC2509]|uniref:hypothetical protein n=1 Tax=Flavobacterium sp. WC2509 TaxID=3461406 RepID=UPI0040445992